MDAISAAVYVPDGLVAVPSSWKQYKEENKDTSILIITHHPKILEYIKPDFVHVLDNGKIIKTGDYNLALDIEKNGYNIMTKEGNNE